MYAAMVVRDVSPVKPQVPASRRPLRLRPTPAVNIRLHLGTYYALRKLCRDTGMTFDQYIRGLLRLGPKEEIPRDI